MLRTGWRLRASSSADTARTTTTYHSGAPAVSGGVVGNATTDRASTIVIQFSQEKLPDSTSHSCVAIISAAAIVATG
ncbi:hypothetical protein SHIRM173S_00670 [Streptomyces hirsutus]